jgi:hypothetical protein
MEAKVDYQVAAPAELRTPNLHRANIAHNRVRMEGWRQRRPGSNGKTPDKKKKNQLDTNRPSHGRTYPVQVKDYFLVRRYSGTKSATNS